jgi:hypothetical protein
MTAPVNKFVMTIARSTSGRQKMDQLKSFRFFAGIFPPDLTDLNSNSEFSGSGLFGGVVRVEPTWPPLRWRGALNKFYTFFM